MTSSADAECLLLRSHSVRTCAVATAVVSALLTGSVRASPPPITVKVATLNTKLGGESPWNPSEQVAVRVADGVVQIVSCHLPAGPIATRARLHWVAEFSKWAAGLQQPQIVGGDFNDTPASRPVAAMKAGYADAWSAAGGRIGGTEAPDDMTYVNRYDYLFSSGGLEIKSVSIPPVKISDHRPVVATYRLGRK